MKLFSLLCLALACGSDPECVHFFSDGSCSSDDGPVMWNELDGTWCNDSICLEVIGSNYTWYGVQCIETGQISGGVEFTPTAGKCLGSEFYSASIDWTDTGLSVFPDFGPAIKLSFAPK